MPTWKILSAAAGMMLMTLVSAEAAPMAGAPDAIEVQGAKSSSDVTQVHYRRGFYRGGHGYGRYGYGYGHGYRRGSGAYIGLGLGAGIVAGAIIANSYYRPRPGYYYDDYAYDGPYYRPAGYGGDPRVLCAENFRSYEWKTGLYTTYGGEKKLCPYLQ
jgi:hypothetical protein